MLTSSAPNLLIRTSRNWRIMNVIILLCERCFPRGQPLCTGSLRSILLSKCPFSVYSGTSYNLSLRFNNAFSFHLDRSNRYDEVAEFHSKKERIACSPTYKIHNSLLIISLIKCLIKLLIFIVISINSFICNSSRRNRNIDFSVR